MNETTNAIESINTKLDQAEERINELEDTIFEIIQQRKTKRTREGKAYAIYGILSKGPI